VCQAHGGLAPQVIAAARRRLLMLIDPALGVLARAVRKRTSKRWEPGPVEIAAVREIMRLAGFSVTDEAGEDHNTVLWEEFIQIHRRVTTTKNAAPAPLTIEAEAVAVK
jgi:hypothetical protein